jgi:5-methyltetrahydrofolate--homocysteine methyltransferase
MRNRATEARLTEDLIFNRRTDALQRYIEYFEKVTPQAAERSAAGPDPDLTPEERLHWCILHRHKDGIEADIG